MQKLSVIQTLPQLLQIDSQKTFTRIIPKIQQQLKTSSAEFHIATSKIFTILMERKVPLNLLNAVLQGIESRDPIICNAWTETLLHAIPTLNDVQIRTGVSYYLVSLTYCNIGVILDIAFGC